MTTHTTNCCANNQLHIAIIGSGSGAFAAAIKASERGAKVTLIEAQEHIGGCCVNVGCVPSKILIRAAQLAHYQQDNPFIGLENQPAIINKALLSQQQSERVSELRQVKYQQILTNNTNISLIKGFAFFKDPNTLIISHQGKTTTLHADKILIATGSKPFIPTIEGLDQTPYWTSTEALFAQQLPQQLAIIGSSVIALEIAQAYARLGSKVTLIARHTLLKAEDPLFGQQLQDIFEHENITVLTHCQVTRVNYQQQKFKLHLSNDDILLCDQLLIATGRIANTAQLNLEKISLATDKYGRIKVNQQLKTNLDNIYAVGDCTTLPQYVYVAANAGSKAGINMTDGNETLNLTTMPAVIFTDPQVATVGLSEQQAQQQGITVISRTLTLDNVPRALANFNTDGFIKLVADAKTQVLLGAQVLAAEGGEIIQTAALAIYNKMTVTELAAQLFPYLTMVEGLKLCAQTFNKDISELSCCAG